MSEVQLLYSDSDLIVCVKPVGLDSEHELPEAIVAQCGGEVFTVHRLDKNVGGVMVYARTKKAAATLSRAITEGSMVKEYAAMVHGIPPEDGVWEDLLFKDAKKNKVYIVDRERSGVKRAKLAFERRTSGERSLVFVRLYTGRSHQIRVQFASRGYPLVGDRKYGGRDEMASPMLFSRRITFPWKGKELCFEAMPDWAADFSE